MHGKVAIKAVIGVIIVIIALTGIRMISKLAAPPMPKLSQIGGAAAQATTLMEQYRNKPFSQLAPGSFQEETGELFASEVTIEHVQTNLAMITVIVFWDESRDPGKSVKLATFMASQDPRPGQ